MKKLFVLMAIVGAFFVFAPSAFAWTPEECVEWDKTHPGQPHPDCPPPVEPPVVVPPPVEEPPVVPPPVVEEPPPVVPEPPIEEPLPPENPVSYPLDRPEKPPVEKPPVETVPVKEVQTVQAQTLPYTGAEDWILALAGISLLAGGVLVRKKFAVR